MSGAVRNVAVLGATGSIGRNALQVIAHSGGRLRAWGLTAHRQLGELASLAARHGPAVVVASNPAAARDFPWNGLGSDVQRWVGSEGLERLARAPEIDVVLTGIVGAAGLRSAWAALDAGKTLALANKETLVAAGPLVMELAARRGVQVLPVDSEHSAVFQCLQGARRADVRRIVLTASGGPFRKWSRAALEQVTIEQALAHPTWEMGPKISIDSATMMNKALEIIEARWLFDLPPEQIQVVVHPQSIVHSLVEFCDGSVLAQLGPPDMKLPIQYALSYPDRWPSPEGRDDWLQLDWTAAMQLEFEPPDLERFPALLLGHEVARQGGTAGAVCNAANEAAVSRFLDGSLKFTEIVPAVRAVLQQHEFDPSPDLPQLLRVDRWAREEVSKWTRR